MSQRLKRESLAPSHPQWMRWVAAFCLALATVMATAQAVHTHGSWLQEKTAVAHGPTVSAQADNEANCPLCVAMHSTLPAAMRAEVPPPVLKASLPAAPHLPTPETRWAFALFSRPPPAQA